MRQTLFLCLMFFALTACDAEAATIIGTDSYYNVTDEDTFASVGEAQNIGFVALRAANPDVNPWAPKVGNDILLPTATIVPAADPGSIVINIGEMRLYYFKDIGQAPDVYPIGIGREGLATPLGVQKISRKADHPTWYPTPRMRAEDPKLPEAVPAGPDNPLGNYAMYLGDTEYRIHGTNKSWGVGRRASSGCIRMYPANIEKIYPTVPVGTAVKIINEPVKMAWVDGALYLEAHPDADFADDIENDYMPNVAVPPGIIQKINALAGDKQDQLNWPLIRDTLLQRNGYPVKITS